MSSSLFLVVWMGLGVIDLPSALIAVIAVLLAYIAVRLAAFGIVRTTLRGKGRAVPMINPLRWLVIRETPEARAVWEYQIGKGMSDTEYLMKYRSATAGETAPFFALPEVRRLYFHSYIVTAEKVENEIIFSDPLREKGYIFYPPRCTRVVIRPAGPARPGNLDGRIAPSSA